MGFASDSHPDIRSIRCPFTNEELAAVPALRPDVAIIHALRADREGNVLLEGSSGWMDANVVKIAR